jgi:hypothetical protein
MEARDLGDTVTFYLPQAGGGSEPYAVFQDRQHLGAFASREEALRFALTLAASIHQGRNVPIRVRTEDDTGAWVTLDEQALPR